MGRILMIGAGGVATVAAFKIAQNADVFTEFMIASRRKEKCDQIVDAIHKAGHTMTSRQPRWMPTMWSSLRRCSMTSVLSWLSILPYPIRISLSWMPVWLAVATISTPPTTNPRTRLTSNIHGSGLTASALKRRDLPQFSAADSTRALPVFSRRMQ